MTPFAHTSVRITTMRHHTERGSATTAHNARLRMNWDRMNDILKRYPLPSVKVVRCW